MITHDLITFILELLFAGIVIYCVNWFVGLLALPPAIKNIVLLIVGIVALLWLLRVIGIY